MCSLLFLLASSLILPTQATLKTTLAQLADQAIEYESNDAPPQCAMYDQCGKPSFFSPPLNCPYDGPPLELDPDSKIKLMSICGPAFDLRKACCAPSQLDQLQNSLKLAYSFVSSCPACYHNLRLFWCNFTCSPKQAYFLKVTETLPSPGNDKKMVSRVTVSVDPDTGKSMFDSCQGIKFGADHRWAMDFIGGGAKNYLEMLRFMGKQNPPFGSPFQIDFPAPIDIPIDDDPLVYRTIPCYTDELALRCACTDCDRSCPTLEPITQPYQPAEGWMYSSILAFWGWLVAIAITCVYFSQRTTASRISRRWMKTINRSIRKWWRRATGKRLSFPGQSEGDLSDERRPEQERSVESDGPNEEAEEPACVNADRSRSWRKSYRVMAFLEDLYFELGRLSAKYPYVMITLSVSFLFACSLGWVFHFDVETDPMRLWVSKSSPSLHQKRYFDSHFEPFYRVQQVIVSAVQGDESVVTEKNLRGMFYLLDRVKEIKTVGTNMTLSDLCFSPLKAPAASYVEPVISLPATDDVVVVPRDGPTACLIQSVTEYWQGDIAQFTTHWEDRLQACIRQPTACLPKTQDPLKPEALFGGIPNLFDGNPNFLGSKALVVTLLLDNAIREDQNEHAESWEKEFVSLMRRLQNFHGKVDEYGDVDFRRVRMSWSTESSVRDEVASATQADAWNVVLSYAAMFIYVTLTLGKRASFVGALGLKTPWREAWTQSRVWLGLAGVLIVLGSVSAALGVLSAYGIKATYISLEVIPFLLLAIGVDNVFLITDAFDQNWDIDTALNERKSTAQSNQSPPNGTRGSLSSQMNQQPSRMNPSIVRASARALCKVGPSLTLSSISQTIALILGWLIAVPAISSFSLFAIMAISINFCMQISCFVALLVLDATRLLDRREGYLVSHGNQEDEEDPLLASTSRVSTGFVDPEPPSRAHSAAHSLGSPKSAPNQTSGTAVSTAVVSEDEDDEDDDEDDVLIATQQTQSQDAPIDRLFQKYAVFVLRNPNFRTAVMLISVFTVLLAAFLVPEVRIGLDQRVALPTGSYLIDYFDDLEAYIAMGPPLFFVVDQLNVTSHAGQRKLCGKFAESCDSFSLTNVLEQERKRVGSSFLNAPTASWLDDFFIWLDPKAECCRKRIPVDRKLRLCRPGEHNCEPCYSEQKWPHDMPQGEEFMMLLRAFLASSPSVTCPVAGTSYRSAININESLNTIQSSYFRTFYAPLRSQNDYINAMASSLRIARTYTDLSADSSDVQTAPDVFPYSPFHVYFEQYFGIVSLVFTVFTALIMVEVLISRLILGSWKTGISLATLLVMMTITFVGFVMGPFDIGLNAVSLVNLLMGVGGLFVEFTSHAGHKYLVSPGSRSERSGIALKSIGPTLLTGITATKLIGLGVLAFSKKSALFTTYYFAMYLGFVLIGAVYALVVLPPTLSHMGDEVMICGRLPDELQQLEREIAEDE